MSNISTLTNTTYPPVITLARLCYRVLNLGRVATFWRFAVIFMSLIAIWQGTQPPYKMKFWQCLDLAILNNFFYGNNFVSKVCPWSKFENKKISFLHVEKHLEINPPCCRVSFCDVAYCNVIVTTHCGKRHLYLRSRYFIIHCTEYVAYTSKTVSE